MREELLRSVVNGPSLVGKLGGRGVTTSYSVHYAPADATLEQSTAVGKNIPGERAPSLCVYLAKIKVQHEVRCPFGRRGRQKTMAEFSMYERTEGW